MPSTTTPMPKPSLPDRTVTLNQLTIHLNGISTGSPPGVRPSMTPSPIDLHDNHIVAIAVPISIILFGVLALLISEVFVCLRIKRGRRSKRIPEKGVEEPSSVGTQQEAAFNEHSGMNCMQITITGVLNVLFVFFFFWGGGGGL